MEKYGRARQATDDNIIRPMRFVCWIAGARIQMHTYLVLTAFSRQQWLCERASMLRYTYIASLAVLSCHYIFESSLHIILVFASAFNMSCLLTRDENYK